jgi:23S rRNA (cytosine1962-C5)-methyltransferase
LEPSRTLQFKVNLPEGQKTGFFLDQTFNIKLLLLHLQTQRHQLKQRVFRILDMCCYMGQWSAQIVAQLQDWGIETEVYLVDVSELALQMAQKNLENLTSRIVCIKQDVLNLDEVVELKNKKFDAVISDPPAFVKNKKDIHQGLHAYTKLNTQAFRFCDTGAVVVSCTCSGLVSMEEFKESLRKAVLKSGVSAKCLAYGGQGWDHPQLMNFPEGHYLKMVMHQID